MPEAATLAEFATVQIVLDHLLVDAAAPRAEVVQKLVMSTETPEGSLLSLIKYYGMEAILAELTTVALLQKAALSQDGVYLLVTPEGIQAVMEYDTWERMAFDEDWGNGSYLQSTSKFVEAVGHHIQSFRGRLPNASFISFDREEIAAKGEGEAPKYTLEEAKEILGIEG